MESMVPHPCESRQGAQMPTSVYRYYDAVGTLIYVGITRQGMGRNVQHNGKAEWWPFVARQEVDHFPTRQAAMLREKDLIRSLRPPFNKQHNPTHAEMREAYLKYALKYSAEMADPLSLYRDLDRQLPMDVISSERGSLVLRSRVEHGPLATLLRNRPERTDVRGKRKYGRVEEVIPNGPTVLVRCFISSPKKVRPPEGGFAQAQLHLTWVHNVKPQYAYIRYITVVEGVLVGAVA